MCSQVAGSGRVSGGGARVGPPAGLLLPRSERELPLPQPQGGGVEQPGPQQLSCRRPARGERAGEGSPGARSQVRSGEEVRAPSGGQQGSGRLGDEDTSPFLSFHQGAAQTGYTSPPLSRSRLTGAGRRRRPLAREHGPGATAPGAAALEAPPGWLAPGGAERPRLKPLRCAAGTRATQGRASGAERPGSGLGFPEQRCASGFHVREAHARGCGPGGRRAAESSRSEFAERGSPKMSKCGLSCGNQKKATR